MVIELISQISKMNEEIETPIAYDLAGVNPELFPMTHQHQPPQTRQEMAEEWRYKSRQMIEIQKN